MTPIQQALFFLLDAYQATVMWFGVLFNAVSAYHFVLAIFGFVVAAYLFIGPFRGHFVNNRIGGRLNAGSSDTAVPRISRK